MEWAWPQSGWARYTAALRPFSVCRLAMVSRKKKLLFLAAFLGCLLLASVPLLSLLFY
ncbi:hypothetical protein [Herbaspirillum rubrisubalbicans]|jgi:hypothetical protein|nr:hypothetical protein [Herbaspirillum rubrisubalbicans]